MARVSYATVRAFVGFCASTMASQFGAVIISGLDMPIVVAFDFRSAAYYAIAIALSNMLIVPHGAVLAALMPVASGMSAEERPQRLGQALLRLTRYSTALLCALALPLLAGMGKLLPVWVGADYASHAQSIAELLIVAQLVRLTLAPYAMFGFSAGQQHRMLISALGEAVVNLAASLLLVRWMGAVGVAAGTLAGALAGVGLHLLNSMPRTDAVQFSRSELLGKGILRPLALSLPAACVFPLVERSANLAVALALLGAAELVLCACLAKGNFSAAERAEMAGLVRHVLSWRRRARARPEAG
jgi:O-antigen/teichoic acid export membrane protein